LASCTQIQAEKKPSEYWLNTEQVNSGVTRRENKEVVCYTYVAFREGAISCLKITYENRESKTIPAQS
jgi:hypothetical protein